jgi:hypothetical protein
MMVWKRITFNESITVSLKQSHKTLVFKALREVSE